MPPSKKSEARKGRQAAATVFATRLALESGTHFTEIAVLGILGHSFDTQMPPAKKFG
jgi:hypothetical protein